MINLVIEQLKNIDSEVAKKLYAIYSREQEKVADDYYSQTIFESQEKYNQSESYLTSQILVVATVDKSGTKYDYKSIMFDSETKKYIDSELSSNSCSDISALLTVVLENLDNDITKWINK